MKGNNTPVFTLTIVAIIVGFALYRLIDFKNIKVENPILAIIYFIVFIFSVYSLTKNYYKK